MSLPFAESRELQQAIAIAESELNLPLGQWMARGPDTELVRTKHAQPALLALGYAIAAELLARGITVTAAAGHSLGELTALTVAGVMTLKDAIRLAYLRGEAMQQAVPEGQGGMVALLGGDDEAVQNILSDAAAKGKIVAANFNAPGHVVVSGDRAALDFVKEHSKDYGIRRTIALDVSAPFHSPLMAPAAAQLRQALATIQLRNPAFPVWSNADLRPYEGVDHIRDALVRQVTAPVRWVEQVRLMRNGAAAIELPPGKVLHGLVKRIEPEWKVDIVESLAALDKIRSSEFL